VSTGDLNVTIYRASDVGHKYNWVISDVLRGLFMTLSSPSSYRAALGIMPHTLALEQSPVCRQYRLHDVNTRVGFGRSNMLNVRAHLKLLIKVFKYTFSSYVTWYDV
jgi:hypothetical protein